jgi:hypothetical protein
VSGYLFYFNGLYILLCNTKNPIVQLIKRINLHKKLQQIRAETYGGIYKLVYVRLQYCMYIETVLR